ncbi:hypothetical protein [Stakelama tenebrarum]|uniref:Uncharacterized protein n=1 Tax=Stakelama tenebrarum TaxID=2711215 RepID=A0A6G6Y482_9SPHN|nr:hypothetical protein [Sphingosinithalassobacter tenebrarum]QIG79754.1 hypothetical protein G5C33_08080 [Sphingosinithalassobacter tenebrarum]
MADTLSPNTVWVEDPDTGEPLIVERDDEYVRIIREFHQNECQHIETEVRRIELSNGAIQVRDCCTFCGSGVGLAKPQKNKTWVNSLPWADPALVNSYQNRRNAEHNAALLALARKQYAERGRFTEAYTAYLKSDAWKAKRALVLKRCGGVCEGCGTAEATEAHHMTYDHLFNEFCSNCWGFAMIATNASPRKNGRVGASPTKVRTRIMASLKPKTFFDGPSPQR